MELLNILCTMGLPAIDESLDKLLQAMSKVPGSLLGSTKDMARIIGLCIALGVGSYEAWMMMLGKRGMDVMKILRIAILSVCIAQSGWICDGLKAPCAALEKGVQAQALAKNQEIAALEKKVANLQSDYLAKLREYQDTLYKAQMVQELPKDANGWDKVVYNVTHLGEQISNLTKRAAVGVETKISEWINEAIRFIGQLIFQMTYYGIFLGQKVGVALLTSFAPLMFALSIAPPWRSAWSQWMAKYITVSLWGFVIYVCLFYIDHILEYNLTSDITAYEALISGGIQGTWEEIGQLGLQGIGSNCMYVIGMIAGAKLLTFVPEFASWLIPGGVSSGLAGASAGVVNKAASMGGTAAMGAVGVASSAAGAIGERAGQNLHSLSNPK